ncbi:MAG: NAD(P)/FAD-dependent oxidoreductase [Halioglobus sp.]|nr:NAD(P)/FAD-dependent oxidoreductase [Halioglobus sp.]
MTAAQELDYVDVLIIGAGLSGVGAACYLSERCPDRSFMLLEARELMGGTWDLFRYPGIRSDSDMFTLGYAFKPWTEAKSLADGPSILNYIRETAAEYDVERHIRYQQKVVSADWDSAAARWTVTVECGESGATRKVQCNFLYSCSGYYRYDEGYTPSFEGQEDFDGPIFHAQHWPEDLDYEGKRVVVIGSGATAVTLVPELAKKTALTTMLQRSPTYVASIPGEDKMAIAMRRFLPERWVYHITRWKKVLLQMVTFNYARKRPAKAKRFLVGMVRRELGPDYDVATHFTPRYNPWDERLCAVPDADMFAAIREKRAEVVTDHIDRFTKDGIALKSGGHLEADIIVLATGLNLLFMGGVQLRVDGVAVTPAEHFVYRGMMLSDVPNFVQTMGYTNSSWTLKADLTAQYVCRVLNHMRRRDKHTAVAVLHRGSVTEEPMMDFSSGYIQRSIEEFPRQARERPWRVFQNYFLDIISLRFSSLTRTALRFL